MEIALGLVRQWRQPAQERSKLELTSAGRLKLTDPDGGTIWEAQITNASYGSLLDSGDFILADDRSSSRYLWQSFDHPRDTILPTQELQINGVLSSRETKSSFLSGRYQLRLMPEGDLVLTNICLGSTGDYGRGPCGFNSICSLDSYGRPSCECLPGFTLTDSSNPYGGCKQEIVQNCDANDLEKVRETYEMRSINNAFWPSSQNYERFPLLSEDKCSRSCFGDCNCIVAVIKDGICWKKKLPLSNGRKERDTYGKALIKRAKNNNTSWDNVGASSIAIFLSYQKTKKLHTSSSLLETNLRVFTFDELKEATNGFREELGRGAFGTAYKGVITNSSLDSKSVVAIKKLENLAEEGDKEFKTEASVIAKTHHKNLVRLVRFCEEGPNRLLVYEFMSNGTLASFVFGISKPDWNKRQQMAIGIARGIAYLHEECTTQIIHCDIKPQNVLLDESYTARISDFGIAKLLMSDKTQTNTMIRGTKGYVAPEWFRSKPVSVKVDVYSYGVLLLELVCCRKNVKVESENEEEIILTDWAYDCYKGRELEKLIENEDEARNDMKRVERLVMVAIWCIQEDHL
ncbi:hypothetical protein L1987_06130 [Smallanthus sonchifolius]|uniref:Uncharacterized protein n=1 Tax=Smallanthus sonchifolius TaxID=185202 RepID=A0ACB9JXH2_9ASTR|nr:hypothetical protein L1987_06130 [Smallanthus sonchifolius]